MVFSCVGSVITFIAIGDESTHVDFSPADMKLSVQELKLQDGDQLIAVDQSLGYVLASLSIHTLCFIVNDHNPEVRSVIEGNCYVLFMLISSPEPKAHKVSL